MKRNLLCGALVLLAGSLLAADGNPKDEVMNAAKKLADAANYSWKTTMDLGPNAQFTPGPTEGKTEKDGLTWMSMTFRDNPSEAVKKGDKIAVKTDEGWESGADLTGQGGFSPGTFMARRMQNVQLPAAEVEDILSKVKAVTKEGDVYSAELTPEGAGSLLTRGFRGRRGGGGGQGPTTSNAKGSAKFWVKDGMLTKIETKVSGKRPNRDGEEMEIERTTTTEISNVGTTQLNVPDEAKKKLS